MKIVHTIDYAKKSLLVTDLLGASRESWTQRKYEMFKVFMGEGGGKRRE
jgi:hypothetical protein